MEYFVRKKERIVAVLEERLPGMLERIADSGPLGADAVRRLVAFSAAGKMLRGGLVALGYELARSPDRARAGDLAAVDEMGAAMELFQSGLLVHDDIMDGDRMRRGAPAIYAQYEEYAIKKSLVDPGRAGESMGICAGDIAFFLANSMIAALPARDDLRLRILALCSAELAKVGIAQMMDVEHGACRGEVEEKDILTVYRFKTGRYTFSLPLAAGAILAEAPEGAIARLERSGELLGVLFQLKDDELGLFSDDARLGKPVGSDIRENKKTILRGELFAAVPPEDRERLASVFGDPTVGVEDIAYVRDLATGLGIRAMNARRMEKLASDARDEMDALPEARPEAMAVFRELLSYSLERTY